MGSAEVCPTCSPCATCHNDGSLGRIQGERKAAEKAGKGRHTGLSSNALLLYGFGHGTRPRVPGTPEGGRCSPEGGGGWRGFECGLNYAADEGDLAACQRTYDLCPPAVQERMLPVLAEFRAWLHQGINHHGEKIWDGRPNGYQS